MSRFRDLWMSGKFAIERKEKQQIDERAEKEAIQALHQLIPQESQQMYQNLSKRRGQETGKWLMGLAGEAPPAAENWTQAQANATNSFEEARVWIDALFQELASLSYGLNESTVGSDLYSTCEKPAVVELRDDDIWYHPVVRSIQGRVTTRFWCLYVKGDDTKISIYIIPTDKMIGLRAGNYTDEDTPPFLVAEHKSENGRNLWAIQGAEAALGMMPHLAKELFGDLIRMSSGKMSETELFSTSKDQPKLEVGQNVAVGYKPQAPSASTANEQVTLVIDETSLHDGCDVLDKIIDRELQKLYKSTASVQPGAPEADQLRKQISALESFRSKIVDAFEKFTAETHKASEKEEAAPPTKIVGMFPTR
ncbi:MAG TPA: hypothetical protein V6C76_12195 [Drouetiella sp.]